jgi:hypothetical protein
MLPMGCGSPRASTYRATAGSPARPRVRAARAGFFVLDAVVADLAA